MELGVDENLISSLLLPGSNHGRRHLSSSGSEPSILVRTSQPLTCPLAEKATIAPATCAEDGDEDNTLKGESFVDLLRNMNSTAT
ncbi:hypothetical protein Bca52824_057616 [Brassica carinata]|uniref:Uncharacterized protein n=1 Tax=Brassica carinata TaxID=52824 RepID=A0A8X7UGD3_BRACI|nr:hypothetical protein Bca52824_057616 [Brassica carinata]